MCFSLSAFPCAADLCAVLRSFLIIFEAMKGFGFCFLGLVWFFVFVCFVVGLFLAPPPPFPEALSVCGTWKEEREVRTVFIETWVTGNLDIWDSGCLFLWETKSRVLRKEMDCSLSLENYKNQTNKQKPSKVLSVNIVWPHGIVWETGQVLGFPQAWDL